MKILGLKPNFGHLSFLESKITSELSITTLMKRIQKLTALSISIIDYLQDQEIECKADEYYRKFINVDYKTGNKFNLFNKLDMIGRVEQDRERDEFQRKIRPRNKLKPRSPSK